MLNIEFKVDEDIIAREVIARSFMPNNFADYLWDKYRLSYMILQKSPTSDDKALDKNIINELKQQDFFKNIIKQSEENCTRISNMWNKSCDKINSFLKKILKEEFGLNMTAYIISPKLKVGRNIHDNKFIWGHSDGLRDNSYDLVYLVHESLHSFFPRNNLTHAIIENISDVELARYLNNSLDHYDYHPHTQSEHIKIYPFWNLYLGLTKQEILKRQEFDKIKYDIDIYEKYREEMSKLNITEFYERMANITSNIKYDNCYFIKKVDEQTLN